MGRNHVLKPKSCIKAQIGGQIGQGIHVQVWIAIILVTFLFATKIVLILHSRWYQTTQMPFDIAGEIFVLSIAVVVNMFAIYGLQCSIDGGCRGYSITIMVFVVLAFFCGLFLEMAAYNDRAKSIQNCKDTSGRYNWKRRVCNYGEKLGHDHDDHNDHDDHDDFDRVYDEWNNLEDNATKKQKNKDMVSQRKLHTTTTDAEKRVSMEDTRQDIMKREQYIKDSRLWLSKQGDVTKLPSDMANTFRLTEQNIKIQEIYVKEDRARLALQQEYLSKSGNERQKMVDAQMELRTQSK